MAIKSGELPKTPDKPAPVGGILGGTLLKKAAAAGKEDDKKPSTGGGLSGTLVRRKS